MPPKKTAATTKSTTKAKADKRKVVKEDSDVAANEDEVSAKKLDEKPSGRNRAPKQVEEEVEAPPEKKKAAKEKPSGRNKAPKETEEKEVEAPPEKKKPAKGAASKKEKAENKKNDIPSENKNEAVEKRPVRSRKNEAVDSGKEKETQPTTKSKKAASKTTKATATKVKEAKKPQSEEESDTEEELSGPPKGRKRQADKKKSEKGEPEKKTVRTNATVTDWEKIDFSCSAKNSKGDTPNFHVTSWNVDGIRAWLKKGGLEILKYDQPDIFCIQETKCSVEKLPDELENIDGYETIWCSSDKEGYAGVGIATKIKPLSVVHGIDSEEHDEEGRCITAEYEEFFLVNVYVPNAGRKLVTLPKRLEWNKLFKEHIKKLDERKPVIVCGDMNVAHTEVDLANPKTNTKNAGFTVEEREGMTDFLQDGFVDTFRQLYPDKENAYTFWTYMANARAKNVGWRLDYFIVSERLMDNVCDNIIHSDALGSDHCPLSLHINI